MTVGAAQFQADIFRKGMKWRSIYSGYKTDLGVMSTAVAADLTTHDITIEQPLGILGPSANAYQKDLNVTLNIGRGGNLSAAAMATAITAAQTALP